MVAGDEGPAEAVQHQQAGEGGAHSQPQPEQLDLAGQLRVALNLGRLNQVQTSMHSEIGSKAGRVYVYQLSLCM